MITGHTFTMTITPDELKNIIREVINESNKDKIQQQTEPKLYTREEAKELLHISLSTLDTYRKKGAIKASRVGTRVLISQEDIDVALQKNRMGMKPWE
jgi:excisionase family DNA binding protein